MELDDPGFSEDIAGISDRLSSSHFSSQPFVMRSVDEEPPPRFSSSDSKFFRWRASKELHFPGNRSLAGDSLRDDDKDAAPNPKPPDEEDS